MSEPTFLMRTIRHSNGVDITKIWDSYPAGIRITCDRPTAKEPVYTVRVVYNTDVEEFFCKGLQYTKVRAIEVLRKLQGR